MKYRIGDFVFYKDRDQTRIGKIVTLGSPDNFDIATLGGHCHKHVKESEIIGISPIQNTFYDAFYDISSVKPLTDLREMSIAVRGIGTPRGTDEGYSATVLPHEGKFPTVAIRYVDQNGNKTDTEYELVNGKLALIER